MRFLAILIFASSCLTGLGFFGFFFYSLAVAGEWVVFLGLFAIAALLWAISHIEGTQRW